jgi:hypothetical protein
MSPSIPSWCCCDYVWSAASAALPKHARASQQRAWKIRGRRFKLWRGSCSVLRTQAPPARLGGCRSLGYKGCVTYLCARSHRKAYRTDTKNGVLWKLNRCRFSCGESPGRYLAALAPELAQRRRALTTGGGDGKTEVARPPLQDCTCVDGN